MKLSIDQNTALKSNIFSWTSVGHQFWQQAQAWTQSAVEWATGQDHVPLFMKAQEDEQYQQYTAWRSDCKKQLRQLFHVIVTQYRQGALVSPEQLKEALIAQQANFEPNIVSPRYYTHYLKRLAQRLPLYAHTLEGVAAHFQESLKNQPEIALQYFYHDVIHQLIDHSRYEGAYNFLTPGSDLPLQHLFGYYQDLVSTALLQAVKTILADMQAQSDAISLTFKQYQHIFKQLNTIFSQVLALAPKTDLTACELSASTSTLASVKDLFMGGWNSLKNHPKIAILGVMGTIAGANVTYQISSDNSMTTLPVKWLEYTLQPLAALPSVIAPSWALPFTASYLKRVYAPSQRISIPAFPITLALVTDWLTLPVTAQDVAAWIKTLGGEGTDIAYAVQPTVDGGYIVTGETNSFGMGNYDLWLSRWSADGTLIWAKTLGGVGNDTGYAVQPNADDSFIVTGYTNSFGAGDYDLWLSKWTANGTLAWAKTLGGNNTDYGYAVQPTADDGYIVTGMTSSFGKGSHDLWLSRWTANGTLSWVKSFGGGGNDTGYAIQPTADEGFVVTGYTNSFGAGNYDLWLTKWTTNGTLTWAKTLGTNGPDYGYDVQLASDGGYVVTGDASSTDGIAHYALLLAKWSADGAFLWAKTLVGTVGDGYGRSVQVTSNDSYLVTGYTNSFKGPSYGYDLWLSKWVGNGTLTWVKTLEANNTDYGYSVQSTIDGGYIVAGSTNSFKENTSNRDLWLSKWDSQGNIGTSCGVAQYPSFFINSLSSGSSTIVYKIVYTHTVLPQSVEISAQATNPSLVKICYNAAANEAPKLGGGGNKVSYTENAASATVISSGITVTDIDSATVQNATVKIQPATFINGEDILACGTNPAGITCNPPVNGVLTLTGPASPANFQTALSRVTYRNGSENPSTIARKIDFQVNDGGTSNSLSDVITSTVTVYPVNDKPILGGGGNGVFYTENAASATVINSGITLTDVDSATVQNATVEIQPTTFMGSEDILACGTNPTGITCSGPVNGVLTLTGPASPANFQTALSRVTYRNGSENPSAVLRKVDFQVNDGGSVNSLSDIITSTITVNPVNDKPSLLGDTAIVTFIEKGAPVKVANNVTLTDPDSSYIQRAQATFSQNYQNGQDVLEAVGLYAITPSFLAANGTLVLSGSGTNTRAQFQEVINTITYKNTNTTNPATADRKITISASDDGTSYGSSFERTLKIQAVNDAPVLNSVGTQGTYIENDPAKVINSALTVTDADSATLQNATVSIQPATFMSNEDILACGSNPTGINCSIFVNGTLTLTGPASPATFQTALSRVMYRNSSEKPTATARKINFQVNDGNVSNAMSNVVTSTINIIAENDAPLLGGGGNTVNYLENAPAQIINSGVAIIDVDSQTLQSATVKLQAATFVSTEDVLACGSNPTNITCSGPANGVLTLIGPTTPTNFQTALSRVTYWNNSNSPNKTARIVEFRIDDGSSLNSQSNVITSTINIVTDNDSPQLDGGGNTVSYRENDPAQVINSAITAADVDSPMLQNAQVSIQIDTFESNQDILACGTNPAGVTCSDPINGVLTLTGPASPATFQTALRQVTYRNSAEKPSLHERKINYQVNDGSGASNAMSNVVTSTITISAENDPPQLSGGGNTMHYIEQSSAQTINSAIKVAEFDSITLQSARVSIQSATFVSGEDILACGSNPTGITCSGPSDGVLTLLGPASPAYFQTALSRVTYRNGADNPNKTPRIVEFQADDGEPSNSESNVVTSTIVMVPINDAPELEGGNNVVSYAEGSSTIINQGIIINDVDSHQLQNATVSIQNSTFVSGEDVLACSINLAGITCNPYDATNGMLILTGPASVSNFQTALSKVTYRNLSSTPNITARAIDFKVNDGGEENNWSNTITSTVNILPGNSTPRLSGNGNTVDYIENANPIIVNSGITVSDDDSDTLGSATIKIKVGLVKVEDELACGDNPVADIACTTYDADKGELTLIGPAAPANFQTALSQVTYRNKSDKPTMGARSIAFQVDDGSAENSLSNTITSTVKITPVNDEPYLNVPVADRLDEVVEQPFSFALPTDTFIDNDNDPLAYLASLTDGSPMPDWIQFDSASLKFSGKPVNPGESRFSLFARDPANATARADFKMVVKAAQPVATGTTTGGTTDSGSSDTADQDNNFLLKVLPPSIAVPAIAVLGGVGKLLYKRYSDKQFAAIASQQAYLFANVLRIKLKLIITNFSNEQGLAYIDMVNDIIANLQNACQEQVREINEQMSNTNNNNQQMNPKAQPQALLNAFAELDFKASEFSYDQVKIVVKYGLLAANAISNLGVGNSIEAISSKVENLVENVMFVITGNNDLAEIASDQEIFRIIAAINKSKEILQIMRSFRENGAGNDIEMANLKKIISSPSLK